MIGAVLSITTIPIGFPISERTILLPARSIAETSNLNHLPSGIQFVSVLELQTGISKFFDPVKIQISSVHFFIVQTNSLIPTHKSFVPVVAKGKLAPEKN